MENKKGVTGFTLQLPFRREGHFGFRVSLETLFGVVANNPKVKWPASGFTLLFVLKDCLFVFVLTHFRQLLLVSIALASGRF